MEQSRENEWLPALYLSVVAIEKGAFVSHSTTVVNFTLLTQWYYLTQNLEDKGVHIFPKGIFSKVNIIARLQFELTYYDSIV